MHLLENIRSRIFGTAPKFKKDDTVQLIDGGPLMVVEEIKSGKGKTPHQVSCVWFDRDVKCTKKGTFSEEELRFFDWYHR